MRFVVVSLLCLGINTLTFALVSGPPLNLGWLVALAAATAASFVLGYWLNRVWTFQQQLSDGK